jgi:hypothetical protein
MTQFTGNIVRNEEKTNDRPDRSEAPGCGHSNVRPPVSINLPAFSETAKWTDTRGFSTGIACA